MSELRTFQMHQNLLRDVIERQAGTLDKAVLEGVMNLIEAKATSGEITLTDRQLMIRDNGKGFETRDEVLAAFEVFGKSDERKKEEKRWARFQMGRGQLFAFGRTTYRTRTFEMIVDIRDEKMGLGYVLRENLPDEAGCTITVDLYERIDGYKQNAIKAAVKRNVEYVDVPILFNGEAVSHSPSDEKWTLETDDAFMKMTESRRNIAVYNLGVFVREVWGEGIGGVVVSKKQLDLNFARNDVLDSCPVWKRIRANYKAKGEKSLLERKSFSSEDVAEVLSRYAAGEFKRWDLSSLPLFKTTNGKRVSLSKIAHEFTAFSLDKAGSLKADKAMQQSTAVIIDAEHYEAAFGSADPHRLEKLVREVTAAHTPYTPLATLYAGINDEHVLLKEAKLTQVERVALGVLRRYFSYDGYARRQLKGLRPRKVLIGTSETAAAWTNGIDYIAVDRRHFRERMKTASGWVQIVTTMAHEYAHVGDERTHDGDFYERFHENMYNFAPAFGDSYREFVKRLVRMGEGKTHRSDAVAMEQLEGAFLNAPLDPQAEYLQETEQEEMAAQAKTKKAAPKKVGAKKAKATKPAAAKPRKAKPVGDGHCRCGNPVKIKNGKKLKNCQECITKAVSRYTKNAKDGRYRDA